MKEILLTITLTLATQSYANGTVKEEIKRYHKCYGQIIREMVPTSTDQYLPQIQNGSMTGAEACMNIINLANLKADNNATLAITNDESYDLRKKVLKTFNDFHRNWFQNYSLSQNVICAQATDSVHDAGSMAYYLTRSMFSDEKAFSEVVTSPELIESVREQNHTQAKNFPASNDIIPKIITGLPARDADNDLVQPLSERFENNSAIPILNRGPLIGFKPKSAISLQVWNQANGTTNTTIAKNLGAGAITTPTYVINNLGISQGSTANGALKVARRWSQNLIKDLLCRDLPVIRASDAFPFYDSSGNSPLPFRNGINCMKCHATMDTMARTIRNVSVHRTANSCNADEGANVAFIHEFNASQPVGEQEGSGAWIDTPVTNFHLQTPKGKLYMRSADGDLIDQEVSSVDELGSAIANNDDLYYCASKRYLQFFTGIDIPLFDIGDQSNAQVLRTRDLQYLELIKRLGKKLKENQSQKELIRTIISSDFYLTPGVEPKDE